MSEIQREIIVKVPEKEAKVLGSGSHPESELSHIDCLMPPVTISFWFFYDYNLETHLLEKALETTLSRYQELAGRLHSRKVILNNEGAKLVIMKDSSLTLAQIDKNDYNFDQLIKHSGAEKPFEGGFLMTLSCQKLACGGMILIFSFNHLLCDVNSVYLFIGDFASQVKNLCFKFDQREVITEKRSMMLAPSGSPPTFDHKEFAVISEEEKLAYFEAFYQEGALPKKTVKLKLSEENKQKLKSFVCGKGEPGVFVSANDCLVALIWTAFIETTEVKESDNEISSTLFLQCNGRFRRQPVMPISFFGNVILSLPITRTLHQLSEARILTTAQKVREKVSSVNEEYVQSTIDYLATKENSQMSFPQKFDFIVSNWDRPFDWYGDANMGEGTPKKFTTVTQALDRCCLVLPNKDDGIEAILGLESQQMGRFQEHPLINHFFVY